MAKRDKLTDAQIQKALQELPNWTLAGGKLHREYDFPDFTHAFGFMAAAATRIEALNHHPEWSNVYGKVIVDLSTHDADGITAYDTELADKLEGIASKLLA